MVAAQASGVADQDTYISGGSPETAYGNDATLWASLSGNASNVCSWTRTTYLQWDLSSIADPNQIGWVGINLARSASGTTSNPNAYVVALYEAGDDWSESSTWNTIPNPQSPPGTRILTKPFPTANGAALTFTSDEAIRLRDYAREQANTANNLMSLAIRLEDPDNVCPTGVTTLIMNSSESTAGAPASLDIRTAGPPPNAVDMSTASAETAASWPLYAGLAAVALFVVAGVVISKRRTA
jgi:hypothetical protein